MFTFPITMMSSAAEGGGSALRSYVQSLDNMTILVDPRSGGSDITESGGTVTDIENLGSAGNFSQATGSSQCTYDGSKLIFDRDFYTISGAITLKTIFAVIKIDAADGVNCLLSNLGSGTRELMTGSGTTYDRDIDTFIGPAHLINGKANYNVPDDTVHVVHGERYTTAYSYGSGNFTIGRQHPTLGARDFVGELLFMVGFSDALTETEANTILGHMATEFSLTTTDLAEDPTEDVTPAVWLDPTTGFTEASGEISNWADQSGNGNDAAQATGTNQPDTGNVTIGSAAVNAVHFETDDYLEISGLDLTSTDDLTVFIVAKQAGAPSGSYHTLIMHSVDFTTAGTFVQVYATNSGVMNLNFPTNTLDASTSAGFSSTPAIYAMAKDSASTGTSAIYQDGGAADDTGTGDQTLQNYSLFIGGWSSNHANADFGDIIIFNAVLTDDQIDRVQTYLARKYAMPALPVS